MTAESLKRHHHHHHHHQHQHKKMVHLKSIERITNLPVFESAVAYYGNMKKSNPLIKWGMLPAETGMWLAVGTAMPVVAYFEKPVSAVDNIACKALDVIEANIPVVTYPPDLIYNISKDYVTNKVVTPMLKRADSVKQLSKHGASICGELAADRLNNAIDVADKYVDKYLPDITDGAETPSENPAPLANSDSKTAATFQHVNQFSRKLQRRLTRRTIAEAKALKQQGADTIRCLVYLVDLLARDPKAFMEKGKAMWMELSKDEPENQVPPQNLEQLITLLTREIARRVVHLTNFTGAKVVLLSQYTVHVAHISALNAVWWADYFLKAMHLETAMEMTATQITRIHHFSVHLMERLVELIINLKKELKSNTPAQPVAAPAIKPIQSQPIPPVPEHLPASPSPQSSPSNVMSTPSLPATGGKHFNSHNGDTYTLYESNHESSVTS
ncbi:lipid storage droplets surface-binding protein 1-like isoform X3 [Macrosteles quadrilineatus]|uniref:lipid storage droplets surface-binding protein 1-like isoform X3 n=1 Tax=Macrosteles quadrilineatus TaxID=74068 RepID=UPI0023E09D1A|nr:lipid storage droplets surface-binding protein 1-like isoform X3 [Macrosteles quadrilineatus]XP_054267208.1 lipid storage droplets surface-binding protein 1-like isoform X3 [Macrosteles quadrilineatus]